MLLFKEKNYKEFAILLKYFYSSLENDCTLTQLFFNTSKKYL